TGARTRNFPLERRVICQLDLPARVACCSTVEFSRNGSFQGAGDSRSRSFKERSCPETKNAEAASRIGRRPRREKRGLRRGVAPPGVRACCEGPDRRSRACSRPTAGAAVRGFHTSASSSISLPLLRLSRPRTEQAQN